MGLKWLKSQRKRINQFALNPAKGTRQAVLDKPKLAPIVKTAADLFTFGIGGAVAEKGFKSDIKKGKVIGLGPNAPAPVDIDVATPVSITPGQSVQGEQQQLYNLVNKPMLQQTTPAQIAQAEPTRMVMQARQPTRRAAVRKPVRRAAVRKPVRRVVRRAPTRRIYR